MSRRSYLSLLLLLCLSANAAWAQSEATIRALFLDPTHVEVRYYRGRMNDINDVVIALGSDGETYRGMMRLFSSGERFLLTGRVDGSHLYLMERDTFGNRTGSIRGDIDDFEGIKADWHNFNKSLGGRLHLIPYTQEPIYPTYCGDNKWVRHFTGHIGTDSVHLLLTRGTNYGLQGRLYHLADGHSYTVQGELLDYSRKMVLRLSDDNHRPHGQFALAHDRHKKTMNGTYTDTTRFDAPQPTAFAVASELLMGCQEYTDFVTTLEVTYPKTRSSHFNDWLTTYLDDWRQAARAYTDQYKTQIPRYLPSIRSRLRSYFWCELDYCTDDLISGQLVHTHTWEADYHNVPFTYDLRTGQPITLDDLLRTDSTTTQYLRAAIDTALTARPYAEHPLFQQWLAEEADFSAFTVRPDGLNFISNHNALFGTQHVTLPWHALTPYLRPDHPLQMLLTP